jgi:hypothetical protein
MGSSSTISRRLRKRKMAEWKLYEGTYVFRGKCLLIRVHKFIPEDYRGSIKGGWYVTCEEARLTQVQLMEPDGEQACNEAIGMVADRIGWLARGWIKDLKDVKSLLLDDPEYRGAKPGK